MQAIFSQPHIIFIGVEGHPEDWDSVQPIYSLDLLKGETIVMPIGRLQQSQELFFVILDPFIIGKVKMDAILLLMPGWTGCM